MRKGVWTAIAVSVAVLGAGPGPARAECPVVLYAYHHGAVVFSEQGRETRVHVEIATTPDQQEHGLMCRTTLDPDAGMLFMFDFNTQTAFWMKNTLIPLSIAFIDSNWHIVRIMDMPVAPDPSAPAPGAVYGPEKPYRYALEVNLGFFTQHGIDEHAQIRFIPEETSGGPTKPRSIASAPRYPGDQMPERMPGGGTLPPPTGAPARVQPSIPQ